VNLPELPLWLWSLLCIAGLAGGMALHLAFHPRRQDFSDAFDLLKNQPRLVLFGGLLIYAHFVSGSDGFNPPNERTPEEWTHWRTLAPSLLEESATRFATLLHQVLPPWPALLLLPLAWAYALRCLQHRPYRAGLRHRPRGAAWALLISLFVITLIVPATEVGVTLTDLPEVLESLLLGARLVSLGLATAGMQFIALRLAVRWQHPAPDASPSLLASAWWDVLGRWRLLLLLGAFNVIWIALQSWASLSSSPLVTWLLVEMLLFFAPLPVAAALFPANAGFLQTGAFSLRLLGRTFLPLISLAISAIAILALTHYAAGLLNSRLIPWPLIDTAFQFVTAFSLAFVHIWLFLAAALLQLSLGKNSLQTDSLPNRSQA
jgi:hypothetical protein